MPYRLSLRTRLIVSYPLLGAVVGLLLTLLLFFALESMEDQYMDDYRDDVKNFMGNSRGDTEAHTAHWDAYRMPADKAPPGFESLANLESGVHEIVQHDRQYDVDIIEEPPGERLYLIIDDTQLEKREQFISVLLIGTFLTTMLATTWFGFWLSGQVIRPIKDLARLVRIIDPNEERKPLTQDFFHKDEVGDLAAAFDAYHDRILTFICREREFTADASHELRSPLAVILATAEGMLANRALPDSLQPKVERIMRAAAGMTGTLEILLSLAREQTEQLSSKHHTDLAAELEMLVQNQRETLSGRPVKLNLELRAKPKLMAPPAAAIMVADNLLRNALAYTAKGQINVTLEEDRLVVADSGPGIAPEDQPHIFERGTRGSSANTSGRGLGLAIANRLCEHFGWSLRLESPIQGGVHAEWKFR